MAGPSSFGDWLDARIGHRTVLRRLSEPRKGPSWARTLGGALLVLMAVQLVTGVTMMLYYVPTPTHAYDSVRYIVSQVPFGAVMRALHYHGASFIVAVAVLHLLRSLWTGGYKAPREFTWLSGVVLLMIVVAFGITGYLLPWDQMGFWASVVRANIAATTPVVGKLIAGVMKGGPVIGALTLSRWYAVHVFLLPAALTLFVLAHLRQVRKHGSATREARPAPAVEVSMTGRAAGALGLVVVVGGALLWWARVNGAPLEAMADPADFTFIPHPEWYFLWLFQLMKFDQGPIGKMGAPVVLMLVIGFLVLVPFLDRRRAGRLRPHASVVASTSAGLAVIAGLTFMALSHLAPSPDPNAWSPIAIAGYDIAARSSCMKCHAPDAVGPNLMRGRVAHTNAWIRNHMTDPDAMAPGIRPIPFDAPTAPESTAVLAFVRKVRLGSPLPKAAPDEHKIAMQYTVACAGCHVMDGDGMSDGPDLTHAGRQWDAEWIAKKIVTPDFRDPKARMPSLAERMTPAEVRALAEFLARRK